MFSGDVVTVEQLLHISDHNCSDSANKINGVGNVY